MSKPNASIALPSSFELPVYDTQHIKAELIKKSADDKSFLAKILSHLAFGIEESTTTTDNLTHLCASNLTARELLSRLARVEDTDLRKKLGESTLAYITGSSNEQLALAFDGMNESALQNLDDDKGDIRVQENTIQSDASAIHVKVYYAKCLLIRENGRYHLNFAYYHFNSSLPPNSVKAELRSENEIKSDHLLAKVAAFNKLHTLLHRVWPNRIQLQSMSTLPDE